MKIVKHIDDLNVLLGKITRQLKSANDEANSDRRIRLLEETKALSKTFIKTLSKDLHKEIYAAFLSLRKDDTTKPNKK